MLLHVADMSFVFIPDTTAAAPAGGDGKHDILTH